MSLFKWKGAEDDPAAETGGEKKPLRSLQRCMFVNYNDFQEPVFGQKFQISKISISNYNEAQSPQSKVE